MKSFLKGLMAVIMVILVVILGLVIWGNYNLNADDSAAEPTVVPEPVETKGPVDISPSPTVEPETPKINATLAVAGDLVCHSGLNSEAYDGKNYDYTVIMSGATEYLAAADYAVCCLETTFPKTSEYTGYPMFKSPAGLAASLKNVGIDLVSTANNHAMDSYKSGLIQTLDVLDENGLAHVGTYRSQEERDAQNGITVADVGDIRVAFLAYTYGTNGIPVTGFQYAVNIFCEDYLTDLSIIDYDTIAADMEAAKKLDCDLIAVFMHWGHEYYTTPVQYQYDLADFLFSKGADIILGGHTHVLQPMELRQVTDEDGNEKTGFICYSLGNFLSCQNDPFTNLTAVLNINLEKNPDTGEAYIKSVGYVPMFMVDLYDYGVTDAGWQYRLWDLHKAIDAYEGGDNLGVINERLYNAMTEGLQDLHEIMGVEYDQYYYLPAAQ
ncbi:MAG TPA: CapA family protein [Clostridiales bacterium]|nr:CapA family protein [Clostridiales bacterium]